MAANTFGELFRVTTWGESHGGAVGAVVDGCPPRLKLSEKIIQEELDRRKPGQSKLTTAREETDTVHILSGVFEGKTLGTPISLLVWNKDARSDDYLGFSKMYRPGHADYTYEQKYGIRNWQGGGRASARETVGRVAAGAIAKQILRASDTQIQRGREIKILGYVKQVGEIVANIDPSKVTCAQIEQNPVRCPNQVKVKEMEKLILEVKEANDSIGGIVECVIRGLPIGLGEPVFDKLDAELAKACMSIPATKGFEIGSGFSCATMRGSEHNDSFCLKGVSRSEKYEVKSANGKNKIGTRTNYAGGVLGGISDGEDIVIRVAFKPASTIGKKQHTFSSDGNSATLAARGRHDPCVLPRAVPVVEAMVAIVLVDHVLRYKAQCS